MTSSTRGVLPALAPDSESSTILQPWAPANLADGSWSLLEQRGARIAPAAGVRHHDRAAGGPSEKGAEPTGAQILAAIESSSRATQTKIAAIAVDVNLLRADLRVLRGPREKILGPLWVNSHLWAIYATPCSVGVTRIREYLDGRRMPRLMEAQSEELEGEVSLDDLVEALG
ncbi:hypothetical protein NDU88_009761 [Pleurodeles waltl]|uniref:Uncharacterized protein n=1 Tax=Pleurodeles waltl TaxID=8319 RepID=A0AAV7QVG7_PLEWA|nr:hypothetical protein NDU88_009761 [Pleurodeles waltl]